MKKIIIVLLWLIGLFAIVYFIYTSDSESKIKIIVSAVSAYAVSSSLLLNAYSIFEKTRADKFNLTLQILSKWDEKHFIEARDDTRKQQNIKEKKGDKEILEEIKNRPELERSIIMMMNYFEMLQTSIEDNRLNENIIMEHFAYMISDILTRYNCFLESDKFKKINPLGFKKLKALKNKCEYYIEKCNS
ncbi:hypothetical protein OLP57_09830 [Campylobacter jejuni]|uniref:DUF4760 domain-containing protein n=1 Tax=Campylobacter jejuni TaxID=197 RepID=UPI000B4A8349|nr:hypothetical protein [Campylobacter jejuni]MCW1343073.1 hypothetical protein [Campylobacter jejuni]OWK89657.1 hypothetical protein B5Z71_05955 [Campylobacter jejuni]RTI83047.1 hypothetical protein C3I08_02060 [Campylobacter jejuni]RTI85312.1 hypothetical protein C3I04_05025 [Campylobacter jejuni]